MNLDRRYLVVGRPPPEGRDLDVLARQADAVELAARLRDDGFVERGGRWVRFGAGDVEVVDLVDIDAWSLPAAEADALFASARPLEDGAGPARPSPAHTVLLEARRWMAGSLLTERRRTRVADALAHDGAWDEVRQRASAWGVEPALPVLRGDAPVREAARRTRRRLARPRGAVVTLSGIDGSGKTSQVEALHRSLERLGYPVETVWTRITINPSLDVIAGPVKWLLARVAGRQRDTSPAASDVEGRPPGHGARPDDPAKAFRLRYPAVNNAWLLVVAVVNAATQWRAVAPRVARGRVVVCDRYTLDSAAHLRYKYGPDSRFGGQVAAIRLLSPRPLRSYLLDVPGSVAHARKPEKYTAGQLEQVAALYRDECERLGVRRLDGTRPPDELAAEIADDVLRALLDQRRRRLRSRLRALAGATSADNEANDTT